MPLGNGSSHPKDVDITSVFLAPFNWGLFIKFYHLVYLLISQVKVAILLSVCYTFLKGENFAC